MRTVPRNGRDDRDTQQRCQKEAPWVGVFYYTPASKPKSATGWPFVTFWVSLELLTTFPGLDLKVSTSKEKALTV